MADQKNPLDAKTAPDPSNNYERSHPERESGMGRLDNNTQATPDASPDRQEETVGNRQKPKQVNAQELMDDREHNAPGAGTPAPSQPQPDHSMKEEEPTGWDQAPTDIHDPRQQRHPRREGKGGTP